MYLKILTDEEKEAVLPRGLQSTSALEQREFLDFIEGKRTLEVTDEIGYQYMRQLRSAEACCSNMSWTPRKNPIKRKYMRDWEYDSRQLVQWYKGEYAHTLDLIK